MEELEDYSGEFRPDLELQDFSKEALVRLLKAYRRIFVGLMGMWNTVNRERMSVEEAFGLDAEVYQRQLGKFEIPQLAEAMKIRGDDVMTLLKIFQVAPDGAGKDFYSFDYDVRSPDHAVLTFTRCPSLFYFESTGSEQDIHCLCGPRGVEERAFIEYCRKLNPAMKCRALKLPPRKSRDEICCRWEFKVEREG